MPFLADTNILLRLVEPSDPEYSIVRNAVDVLVARGERLCYAARSHRPWDLSHTIRTGAGIAQLINHWIAMLKPPPIRAKGALAKFPIYTTSLANPLGASSGILIFT